MKSEGLRIGNLLNDGLEVISINDLDSHSIWLHDYKEPAKPYQEEDLKPIPITPDWLYKCGFEKTVTTTEFFYALNQNDTRGIMTVPRTIFSLYASRFHFELSDGDFFVNGVETPIEYVHQLQNLYFILVGEELKIENKTSGD